MAALPLLDRLDLGDHLCWTVGDDAVRLESLTEVVQTGLRAGHRVVYCGDDLDGVTAAFERHGVLAGDATAADRLRFVPVGSCYLPGGAFDCDGALGFLRREIGQARRAGHPGLRLITDMSWASRPAPGIERLAEFEAAAGVIFADGFASGVCVYDPRIFDRLRLREFSRAHPGTVGADAPFDPDLVLRIRRTGEPYGLRLAGEADLLSQPALIAALEHVVDTLPAGAGTAVVDVSGLRFVDTAAARVLLRATDQSGGRLRLVGRSAALARLLDLRGTGRPRHDQAPVSVLRGNPE